MGLLGRAWFDGVGDVVDDFIVRNGPGVCGEVLVEWGRSAFEAAV